MLVFIFWLLSSDNFRTLDNRANLILLRRDIDFGLLKAHQLNQRLAELDGRVLQNIEQCKNDAILSREFSTNARKLLAEKDAAKRQVIIEEMFRLNKEIEKANYPKNK